MSETVLSGTIEGVAFSVPAPGESTVVSTPRGDVSISPYRDLNGQWAVKVRFVADSADTKSLPDIEPALGAEEWARISAAPRILSHDEMHASGPRMPGVNGMKALAINLSTEQAQAIAVLNATLPDSDPRKITREMIDRIRDAEVGGPQNSEWIRDDARTDALHRFADALESYLPPEK